MGKYNILVVDDNPDAITLLSAILQRNLDCSISVARDGMSAVLQAKEQIPNLILMDWMMPEFDGLQAVSALKADFQTVGVPIIMVTGVVQHESMLVAYKAGVSDFITKPIVASEMMVRVQSALRMNETYLTNLENLKNEHSRQADKTIAMNDFQVVLLSRLKDYEAALSCGLITTQPAEELLNTIIHDLEQKDTYKTWDQLDDLIRLFEPKFHNALLAKHPNLSSGEIKLCYLLRLNLSNKDISNLTFKTSEVIHLFRIRLRKKLRLSSSDNLSGYLLSL